MNFYEKRERVAIEALDALLAKPAIPKDGMCSDGECFDPWDLFPCLFGSYDSAFDDMAIEVLTEILNRRREDLAADMFREMLCTASLCDYGTSPRSCFAIPAFRERLPQFIERWREYSKILWED